MSDLKKVGNERPVARKARVFAVLWSIAFLAIGAALFLTAGCATNTAMNSTRPQPGQLALVLFKITHQDRAGESGTMIRKSGEIVTMDRGDAVIAGDEGDILRCPAKSLHAVTPQIAAALPARKQPAPDFIAAEELERWFPADTVPFTLRWLPPEEIAQALRQAKPRSRSPGG